MQSSNTICVTTFAVGAGCAAANEGTKVNMQSTHSLLHAQWVTGINSSL